MDASSTTHWRYETDAEGIAWLHFDYSAGSTNVLSAAALEELAAKLEEIEAGRPAALIIVSDKPQGFIAGADVHEFKGMNNSQQTFDYIRKIQQLFDRIEKLVFPTLCAIHGYCLGGGLELALACRYRLATDDPGTRLGLPEVRLGIHPGFGGTVRVTRLLGPVNALPLMLTGRTVSARAAQKIGLIHYAVPQRHLHRAARQLAHEQPPPKGVAWHQRLLATAPLRPALAWYLRREVAKRAPRHHYPAPYALLDLWQRHSGDSAAMTVEEAHSVARLLTGDTAQNLIRVFFLQERLKGLGRDHAFRAQHVHVIGAGIMGGDIAAWCALRGLSVSLQDQAAERIAPAIGRAHDLFKKKLKQPRLVQAAMDRLFPDLRGTGVAKADIVIEAIFENLDVKRELYRAIEPQMRADALLATNTSSIPLEELAEGLQQPQRLVGLHFFNPVAKMQLVEIVTGSNTAAESAQAAAAFARQIDRLPLPVKSTPGFLVNRILMPYLLEAVTMVEEGIAPVLIDRAATDFGMPMGPVELGDTVGLDICLSVAEILSQRLGGEVPALLREHVKNGRLGRKSGQGFYSYAKGKAVKPKPDKSADSSPDIQDRLLFRLFNEAARCLREDVVADADLLDAGIVFGTGFAPFRGGPAHYVQSSGTAVQQSRLAQLERKYGERFSADPGWGAFEPAAAASAADGEEDTPEQTG